MRLVTFLLLIQFGYAIGKSIENPGSCNDSRKHDPGLKGNDENETNSDVTETPEKYFDNRKSFPEPNNDKNNNTDIDKQKPNELNEFASNPNTLPEKLPLVSNFTNVADINKKENDTKNAPLQHKVYYQAIDPKYIIVSRLSMPKINNNVTSISKTEDPVHIDVKETIKTPKDLTEDSPNTTTVLDVPIGRTAGIDAVDEEIGINTDTDISNIRELRKHLLDHLLDYFLNIIKDENYIHNDTRKKNGKDRMKVEMKLRNYYDPHHLDLLLDDNDFYDESNTDDYRKNNDDEDDLLYEMPETENIDDKGLDKNVSVADNFADNLNNQTLNLDEKLNSSRLNNKPAPVTEKYIEKENDLDDILLNTTENYEDSSDDEINVLTTTDSTISNTTSNDLVIDKDLLNYTDEVTNQEEYTNDDDTMVVDDNTYEDYTSSDEFEIVKNITVHENERITEDGRRKQNEIDKKQNVNATSIESNNKTHILFSNDTSNSIKQNGSSISKKEFKSSTSRILELLDKYNIDDIPPCNDGDVLIVNKNKMSSKIPKENQVVKEKIRSNKICGRLVNNKNNKLKNKHSCKKSIILNLNINLK